MLTAWRDAVVPVDEEVPAAGSGGDDGGDGGGEGGEGGGGGEEKMRTSARLRIRFVPGSTMVT